MERWVGRPVLVTGASVGIGAAVCEKLVKHGMNVIGCARNVDAIAALSDRLKGEKGRLLAVRCDVTKEQDILAAFQKAKEEFGGVDVCINNAGLAHNAPLLSGAVEQWRDMVQVNVLGVAICTREAYKSMKDRKVDDGHIINVNSMSGHRLTGSSTVNFYSATKYALTAMTEGVRSELRSLKSNIRVSQISPGLVATEFRERMLQVSREDSQEYFAKTPALTAEEVADGIIYQLSAPPGVQVHDVLMRPTTQVL